MNLKVKFEDYTDSLRVLLVCVPYKYLRRNLKKNLPFYISIGADSLNLVTFFHIVATQPRD